MSKYKYDNSTNEMDSEVAILSSMGESPGNIRNRSMEKFLLVVLFGVTLYAFVSN